MCVDISNEPLSCPVYIGICFMSRGDWMHVLTQIPYKHSETKKHINEHR